VKSIQKMLSTSYLPSRPRRRFLFVFGHTDGFWARTLKGYTHVTLLEYIDDNCWILIDPKLSGAHTDVYKSVPDLKDLKVLEVIVQPLRRNRLLRIICQSCATIVQYHASLSLGAITCQGLYEALTITDPEWLEYHGILEVKPWVMR
jgi:hypothetical protein